jgi:hypothetical protein
MWQDLIVAEANMKSVGLTALFHRTEPCKSLYDFLGFAKCRGPIGLDLFWEVLGALSIADGQNIGVWCRVKGYILITLTARLFIFDYRSDFVCDSYLRKHTEDGANRSVRREFAGGRVEDYLSIPLLGGSCRGGILEQTVTEAP